MCVACPLGATPETREGVTTAAGLLAPPHVETHSSSTGSLTVTRTYCYVAQITSSISRARSLKRPSREVRHNSRRRFSSKSLSLSAKR